MKEDEAIKRLADYYAQHGTATPAALLVYVDGVTLFLVTSESTQSEVESVLRSTEQFGYRIRDNARSADGYCGVIRVGYPDGEPAYDSALHVMYGSSAPHELLCDLVGEHFRNNGLGTLEWSDHRLSDMNRLDHFPRWLEAIEKG